jgi:hypothetical protein
MEKRNSLKISNGLICQPGRLILLICIFLPLSSINATTLVSKVDGELVNLKHNEITAIKAGTPAILDILVPYEFRSEGHVPLLLVPSTGSMEIQLDPLEVKSLFANNQNRQVSQLLSKVMVEIERIQKLIRTKQLKEALIKVQSLESSYPGVAYLGFLKASVLLLNGSRGPAEQALREALKVHPDYEEGKAFLQQIQRKAE